MKNNDFLIVSSVWCAGSMLTTGWTAFSMILMGIFAVILHMTQKS